MLESSRREKRAGREEKGDCRRGCRGGAASPSASASPPGSPGSAPAARGTAPGAPRCRTEAGGGTTGVRHKSAKVTSVPSPALRPLPAPGQPGPGPGRSRPCGSAGAARGPPRRARPGPRWPRQRSAPRLRERSPAGGRTELLPLRRAPQGQRPRRDPRPAPPPPAHLGVPLQAPRGRGICGFGGPAAPRPSPRIPLRTSARGALTSAHLSSPHRRGRPAPQEPRRSPPPPHRPSTPAPSSPASAPRPEQTPGNAYRSSCPDPRRQPGGPLPRDPLPPRPRGPAALAEQKPSRSGCGLQRGEPEGGRDSPL
ncbi:proline-rich protein 2-like [Vidua macroura]|uniref:proline-rich protein 2-like n=1 Tax=Vidua macroura TaxID=187451 RepID=UPI0023A7D1C8|nr:proline-rich protein 2-like [Vidua macroura]